MIYTDGISVSAMAKNLGISRAYVRQLIDKGVFKLDEHKKLSVSQCKQAWSEHQEQAQNDTKIKARTKAEQLLKDVANVMPDDFKEVYKSWISQIKSDPIEVLNAAKAYLTVLQVKAEKIKLDELEKRVFTIEQINADAEKVGTAIRAKLTTLPGRVSTMCEGRNARDIEEIITNEINTALEELQTLFV
ncbi:MAG: hypothetical protein PUA61_08170 [Succinatimonas hippei]|nr:hypothetical protein [Succinatimonas hippei]